MNKYTATFEKPNGSITTHIFEAPNLITATIECSNIAEDNGWEFLAVDEHH